MLRKFYLPIGRSHLTPAICWHFRIKPFKVGLAIFRFWHNYSSVNTTRTNTFTTDRTGTGTKQWSDYSHNICTGCSHGCLYCYAHSLVARFKHGLRTNDQWRQQRLSDKGRQLGADVGKKKGLVMFPTAHDITPEFLDESLTTIKNLLKNNQVLIVSKPHLSVIETLCRELEPQKANVMFRFSLGTLNQQQTDFWEPFAPKPNERLAALQHAYKAGYKTSISAEPMLDDNLGMLELVKAVDPLVTDTIWLGKMQRVNGTQNRGIEGFAIRLAFIKEWQRDEYILRLVELLATNPKVKWKDSIKRVIEKHRQAKK